MPSVPPKSAGRRFRANRDITIERRGEAPRVIKANEECRNVPDNWPPKWVEDAGWVSEIHDDSPAPGASEENA